MKYDYLRWANAYATGVAAAADKTATRRVAAQPQSVANRARGAESPCGIKGCKRHSYKGRLCRKHWNLVPQSDKVQLMIACMESSRATAAKYHRRFLRQVQSIDT